MVGLTGGLGILVSCPPITCLLSAFIMDGLTCAAAFVATAAALRILHHLRLSKASEDATAQARQFDHLVLQSPGVVPVISTPTKEVEHFPVMDLGDFFGSLQRFPSPMTLRKWPQHSNYVAEGEMTLTTQVRALFQ